MRNLSLRIDEPPGIMGALGWSPEMGSGTCQNSDGVIARVLEVLRTEDEWRRIRVAASTSRPALPPGLLFGQRAA